MWNLAEMVFEGSTQIGQACPYMFMTVDEDLGTGVSGGTELYLTGNK